MTVFFRKILPICQKLRMLFLKELLPLGNKKQLCIFLSPSVFNRRLFTVLIPGDFPCVCVCVCHKSEVRSQNGLFVKDHRSITKVVHRAKHLNMNKTCGQLHYYVYKGKIHT